MRDFKDFLNEEKKITKEKLKKSFEKIKEKWTFTNKSKRNYSKKYPKIWENYGKFRIYVPRNAFEDAGYVTIDKNDAKTKHPGPGGGSIGEYKGLFYFATRPGNSDIMREFIDDLIKNI